VLRRAFISEVRPLGQDGRHLQVQLCGAGAPRGLWRGKGQLVDSIRASASHPFDVVFSLETSTYGEPHAEMRIFAMNRSGEGEVAPCCCR